MIGIVVVGHNRFAEGVTSSVQMIAGEQAQYETVKFLNGENPEDLFENIRNAVNLVNTNEGVIIFTDIKGGTPFQQAALLSTQIENVRVFSGTNVGMLLEASIIRTMEEDVNVFAEKLVQTGIDQVSLFDVSSLSSNDVEPDEGI